MIGDLGVERTNDGRLVQLVRHLGQEFRDLDAWYLRLDLGVRTASASAWLGSQVSS